MNKKKEVYKIHSSDGAIYTLLKSGLFSSNIHLGLTDFFVRVYGLLTLQGTRSGNGTGNGYGTHWSPFPASA